MYMILADFIQRIGEGVKSRYPAVGANLDQIANQNVEAAAPVEYTRKPCDCNHKLPNGKESKNRYGGSWGQTQECFLCGSRWARKPDGKGGLQEPPIWCALNPKPHPGAKSEPIPAHLKRNYDGKAGSLPRASAKPKQSLTTSASTASSSSCAQRSPFCQEDSPYRQYLQGKWKPDSDSPRLSASELHQRTALSARQLEQNR